MDWIDLLCEFKLVFVIWSRDSEFWVFGLADYKGLFNIVVWKWSSDFCVFKSQIIT